MNTFESSTYYVVQFKDHITGNWFDAQDFDSLFDAAEFERQFTWDTRIIKRVITNVVLSENINKYNKE